MKIKTLIGIIVVAAIAIVGYATLPSFGGSFYQRMLWVGEYFAAGSSEQLQINSEGSLETTGTLAMNDFRLRASADNTPTAATTTPWALQSPSATSTLIAAWCRVDVSSTTASTLTIARAATPYATTTLLGRYGIAANAQATVVASSTPTAGEATTFSPNTYLVVGMAGGIGTFSPSGSCGALWATLD